MRAFAAVSIATGGPFDQLIHQFVLHYERLFPGLWHSLDEMLQPQCRSSSTDILLQHEAERPPASKVLGGPSIIPLVLGKPPGDVRGDPRVKGTIPAAHYVEEPPGCHQSNT